MREIKSCYFHTLINHLADSLGITAGGTYGAYNLRFGYRILFLVQLFIVYFIRQLIKIHYNDVL